MILFYFFLLLYTVRMLILSYEHPMVLMQLSVVGCRVLGADLKGKGQ